MRQKRLKLLRYFGAKTYMLDDIFNKVYELYPDRITTFVDVFGGCLDYKELIKKYDSPTTFFYLDPPYLKGGKSYKFSFTLEDFKELHNIITNIKGYWLMNESERDFPELIKIFGEPQIVKEYSNSVNTNSGNRKAQRKEGFWYNF